MPDYRVELVIAGRLSDNTPPVWSWPQSVITRLGGQLDLLHEK